MQTLYDIIIVGAGMFGSAAARHVTQISPNSKVCVIGPEEPKFLGINVKAFFWQEGSRDGIRTLYGAHYDQGRITREAVPGVWSVLAKRSICRYRDLERQAGITFYEEVGCLTVAPLEDPFSVDSAHNVINSGATATIGNWSEVRSTYNLGYFNFDTTDQAILEHGSSGYINPRRLVEAELLVAQKQGCDVIRDIVRDVTEVNISGTQVLQIQTDTGKKFLSKKVLLATGSFTSCKNLLPFGFRPNLKSVPIYVLLAEVSEADRNRFWRMPCLLSDRGRSAGSRWGCSMLPPIQYPDGKYYIKIGHGDQENRPDMTEWDMKQWFCNPAPKHGRDRLLTVLNEILPNFIPVSVSTDTCVKTMTPTRRPYIDMVTPRLGLAVGGNGVAAKSCDEIGRLAANMIIHGKFLDSELSAEDFKFQTTAKI